MLVLLAPYGLVAAAFAIMGSAYFNTAQIQHALHKHCGIDLGILARALVKPTATALAPLAFTLAVRYALELAGINDWSLLASLAVTMALSTIVSLRAFSHPIWEECVFLCSKTASRWRS